MTRLAQKGRRGDERRGPMQRRKKREIYPKKKNPSYVTPTGLPLYPTLLSHLVRSLTRDLRACSKSRFPAKRSLYSTLLPAVNTSPAHHSPLPPMSFSSFILVLVLSRFIYVPLPFILFIFRFRVLTNCNDVFKVARMTLTNSLCFIIINACLLVKYAFRLLSLRV